MTLALFLVETAPAVIARCQAGAHTGGMTFRIRAVLPGPSVEGDDEAEDDGRVAPLLLRVERTAEALDCSPSTVKCLISAGELPAVKVHGATRVRVDDLRDYVERLAAKS